MEYIFHYVTEVFKTHQFPLPFSNTVFPFLLHVLLQHLNLVVIKGKHNYWNKKSMIVGVDD